jgi:hypothetical protein
MKIYTKTGDKGQTALIGGRRVSKADLRIDTYGKWTQWTLPYLNFRLLCCPVVTSPYPSATSPERFAVGPNDWLFR